MISANGISVAILMRLLLNCELHVLSDDESILYSKVCMIGLTQARSSPQPHITKVPAAT
jgi:hypothetical protein